MRRSTPRLRVTSVLAAVALIAAACSGSDGDSADTIEASPASEAPADTEPPATEPPATEPAATEPPATEPPATEPPATEPPVTEPPPENAPDIDITDNLGPYEVGVQTITLADTSGGERDLTVDVWFPLGDASTAELMPQRYTFVEGTYYDSPDAFAATAESLATDGPYPLVIYSHGSGGVRFIHADYTEALASHGYIVAATDHIGNTAIELVLGTAVDPEANAINRLTDVQRVLNAFLDPESIETVGFVGSVNPDQIAVTGHSAGGFTAYAMASGYSNSVGEFVADERVDAVVTLAPATQALSDDQLLSISIPALVMAGTADETTPIDPNVTRPWNLSTSSPSYRVDLVDARHESFTDLCAYREFLPSVPDPLPAVVELVNDRPEAGCDEADMPIERVRTITNTFAISFLDSVFKGGTAITLDEVDEQTDLVYAAE